VDEAILLSDRIALMTRGPVALLAELVDVGLPRPRSRARLIDDREYLRLRSHILRFLVEGAVGPGETRGGLPENAIETTRFEEPAAPLARAASQA